MAHNSIIKKIFLLCAGLILIRHFCLTQTDGFSLSKIHSDLSFHEEWKTSGDLGTICDQPFHYLGHGAQVFAFVSEDQTAILKFYRHHRTKHPLQCLAFVFPRISRTLEKRKLKRVKDFSSYKIAYDHLPEETGLLYVHLNKTAHLKKKVELYDKIGVRLFVDLDKVEFLLQKKANLVYSTLEEWIERGDFQSAEKGLTNLVQLLRVRHDKGIFDKDPDLKTNFGFIGDQAIQFDIGRFKQESSQNDSDSLIRITDRLCVWLDEKAPQLAEHLRREVR
ncbi:MAG: hypothetical protein K1000chlam2_00480 [Chlamydiae bacterium]|nr:hypothetical protein [Chlamydiota bacterium]